MFDVTKGTEGQDHAEKNANVYGYIESQRARIENMVKNFEAKTLDIGGMQMTYGFQAGDQIITGNSMKDILKKVETYVRSYTGEVEVVE